MDPYLDKENNLEEYLMQLVDNMKLEDQILVAQVQVVST
jgi:hypothetical protein